MSTKHQQHIELRKLIRRQHGVVSLEQAVKAGYSRQAVARKVATKAWFPAGPRVYQVGEHNKTARSRTVTALLSLGPDATLVGTSAAWWWGFCDTPPPRTQVAVPPGRRPRPRDDVDIVRRAIASVDRTKLSGVAVTSRALTVLDAAAELGLDDGATVADTALQKGSVTVESLREAHTRTAGRRGATIGAQIVALAAGGARSWAERALHREMRAVGITGWSANTGIDLPGYGRALGDVVFDEEKVIVEVDGWAYHRDLRAFLVDGPRQSALAAAGWVVLRTHWYELRQAPDVFVARLRATLRARS
ncbi:type IV toxin-antitoxin system AbiEi family antitoxin domain-containing protein [Actinomycetospora aeridis]|uniref:Type IV toxin-antitoxin system AbiEi family antitoxin domain-containing protein n=1 Tax=Actinomycetospora aeridis TaxID=3129231 RepID=A0ABU8MZR9_9PSEU